MRGTVGCTGLGTCDLALAETKEMSLEVARRVDRAVRLERPLSINWSGCPAGCANHQVADIGLQGDKARVNGEVVEVYHVFVGGKAGAGACPGTRVVSQVPAHRIGGVIERLARAHSDGCDIRAVGRQIAAELGETDEQVELVPTT